MAPLWTLVAVFVAGTVKGIAGLGFPTLATPLLSLAVDVKTAVALLILPNIVMDGIQFARRGAIGTIVGTRLLVVLPTRTVLLLLGGFVVAFVALNATRVSPRLPAAWEPWVGPVAGFVAGVVGGVTNVPGTPLAIYFYALGMSKTDFLASTAFTFLVYKLVQLAAVAWYGLLSTALAATSVALTGIALAGFVVGLWVQNRLDQRAFNTAVLALLGALGLWLIVRSLLG